MAGGAAYVDPFAIAIAVARSAQNPDGLGEARSLLLDYVKDGCDPLRIAYAACQLLALADEAIDAETEGLRDFLGRLALQVSATATDRGPGL